MIGRAGLLALAAAALASPTAAQSPTEQAIPGLEGGGPLEIEAATSLEWQREAQRFVAEGDVRLRYGETTLTAERLTARYREGAGGETEIWEVVAEGGVVITTPDGRAQAERGVYDLDRDVFVLTGANLRLETPGEVITARDSLEYWPAARRAVARGEAVAVRGTDRIAADVLEGELTEDATGGLALSRVSAAGNVLITTATDSAAAEAATYDLQRNVATLTGSVRLSRGGNQVNGDAAEVDLASGISRLTAGPNGGRVRALLVPDQ